MDLNIWKKALFQQVNGKYLALMRMMLGLVLFKESYRIFKSIYPFYIEPDFVIKWPFLEWIPLFSESTLKIFAGIIAIGGAFILIGFYSRIAAFVTALAYGYFLFLDCSYYNNHYYLIFLFLIIFSICSQDNQWSILTIIKKTNKNVPAWNIALLRFQLVIVYLYGGFAKINQDWLSGKTMRASIDAGAYASLLEILGGNKELLVFVLTHGGWIFDISVPFLLLFNKTRNWTVPLLVCFHLINAFNLNIGVFPYMMMFSTLIFYGDGWKEVVGHKEKLKDAPTHSSRIIYFVFIYVLFQLFFPMRHFLFPGNYNITGEGYNFSWKMKGNAVELKQYEFYLIDIVKNDTLNIATNLHQKQFNRLYLSPATNIFLANYLKNTLKDSLYFGNNDIEAYVYVKVVINGGDNKYLIDNQVNLLKYKYSSFGEIGRIIVY